MQVAIIGAGPRGLLVANQLVTNYSRSKINHLTIRLFDRFSPGGRIWRINQPVILQMNTCCQRMTMFPKGKGPDFYQWCQKNPVKYIRSQNLDNSVQLIKKIQELKPNSYAPRCIFGLYLRWFYSQTVQQAKSKGIKVEFVQHAVYDVKEHGASYLIIVENGTQFPANRVVFNLGQKVNGPNRQLDNLGRYAQQNHLFYSPIGYAAEKNLTPVKPSQPVIIRGLGFSFYDVMNLLTIGRGGHFIPGQNHQINYEASGKEPVMIVGSKRGLPAYCQTSNPKLSQYSVKPYFLGLSSIKNHFKHGKLSYKELIRLLKLDLANVYYPQLIRIRYHNYNPEQFQNSLKHSKNPGKLIQSYNFRSDDRFNLHHCLLPIDCSKINNINDYQKAVVKWLDDTVGGMTSKTIQPFELVIKFLQNLENTVRGLIDHHRFTPNDYINHCLPLFYSLNKILAAGVPTIDYQRLSALIRAGIIILLPPEMEINTVKPRQFVTFSNQDPENKFKARSMIEAWNPCPRMSRLYCPLTRNMFIRGFLTRPQIKLTANPNPVTLDCANVRNDTDQMVNQHGESEPRLYTWGVYTENVHWHTTNAPRNTGHDVNLEAAARIAKDLLNIKHRKFDLM